MVVSNRTLVIENDPTDDIRRLGDWLTAAGLALETCRPHRGDPLPETLDGYAALVVMGGAQSAYPAPDGSPAAARFPRVGRAVPSRVRRRHGRGLGGGGLRRRGRRRCLRGCPARPGRGVAAVRRAVRRHRGRYAAHRTGLGTPDPADDMNGIPPGMARPVGAAGALARYRFADAGRAQNLLRELHLWDGGPADPGAEAVLDALGRTADPDLALRQLHRLADGDQEVLVGLRRNASLRDRLLAVLGASDTLGDHLVANPGEWRTLAAPNGSPVRFDGATVPRLRMAYRRSLLRIAAGDLTDALDVEQTMTALSTLADATLGAAFRLAGGDGTRLAVIAMGKCGGNELNYVSDVDVIFVARADEDLSATTRVAAKLMEICGQVAWPVDAALRPEGSRGPLVRTLASHLAYYQQWARTWEFQALLKARPATGDLDLGQQCP